MALKAAIYHAWYSIKKPFYTYPSTVTHYLTLCPPIHCLMHAWLKLNLLENYPSRITVESNVVLKKTFYIQKGNKVT